MQSLHSIALSSWRVCSSIRKCHSSGNSYRPRPYHKGVHCSRSSYAPQLAFSQLRRWGVERREQTCRPPATAAPVGLLLPVWSMVSTWPPTVHCYPRGETGARNKWIRYVTCVMCLRVCILYRGMAICKQVYSGLQIFFDYRLFIFATDYRRDKR